MKDLFGNDTPLANELPHGGFKRIFYSRRYRLSDDPLKRCKTCMHLRKKDSYQRNYYKCFLVGNSDSEASDIRLKNVCNLWDMEVKTIDDYKTWLGTFAGLTDPLLSQAIKKIDPLIRED